MFRQLIGLRVAPKTLNFNVTPKLYCPQFTMSTQESNKGLLLNKVVDALEKFANPSLAASWDNVGLLVEPTDEKIVSQILLTNDLTENVMQEALDLKTDMIITYHPLIFAPLKSVTTRSWKERIVAKCLENKIAVYSPHTSFDSVQGGVNDWLASAFKTVLDTTTPIQPDQENPAYGMGRLCTLKDKITANFAVEVIKQHTNLKHVRLARARRPDAYIKTIALCAGSGVSVLRGVPADLYVTGEMLHHDVLDAVENGVHVILTNHSDSERGFLKEFACTLRDLLQNSVNVHVSESDADPLETV